MYEPAYLLDPDAYGLEPGLVRQSGQQYVQGLPGVFTDCAPDRWGRNLSTKQRRAMQWQSKRAIPRPGADVPRLMTLPRLLAAADAAADSSILDDLVAIKALLDAGSGSLGGAPPKASVRGDDGALL